MEELIVSFIGKYYQTKRALLLGYVAIFFLAILAVDDFLEKGMPNFFWRLIIYFLLFIIWTIAWVYLRRNYPKCHKGKLGLIVCIASENAKQKNRIRTDFINRLKRLSAENDLSNVVQVVVLNDYQSKKVGGILTNYGLAQNKLKKTPPQQISDAEKKDIQKWIELQKIVKGSFYIWGTIIERQSGENTYFLAIDGLVVHTPVSAETEIKIKKDFLSVFPKEISFFEKLEFQGFRFTADMVFLAVKYITGIAALVSRDFFLALKLHGGLLEEFKKFQPLPPNLMDVRKTLVSVLAEEYFQVYRYYYFTKRDFAKAEEMLNKALAIDPTCYGALLAKSYIEFADKQNPLAALRFILSAKKYSAGNFTWLYNQAFLFIYLEKFTKALKCYKKISNLTFVGEDEIVDQCINFNDQLVLKEPTKYQCLYINGFLYLKKKRNFPMALDCFDKFLNQTRGASNYAELISRAESHKQEIERSMQLS